MDGLLLVDKPSGPTSHDVVARMRRVLRERRIGHTGTLDPMASGVLPLVVGRATRLARFLSAGDKTYEATLLLGASTDTCDAQGQTVGPVFEGPWPVRAAIDAALDRFRGRFLQQPPAFSAKKIAGRRSYELARAARSGVTDDGAGATGEAPVAGPLPSPVPVTAHAIELLEVAGPVVRLRVACSAGFYIRSLAHDLGAALGTGAHLTALRRTASAGASLERARPLAALEAGGATAAAAALVPLDEMLEHLPAVVLTPAAVKRATSGRDVGSADTIGGLGAAVAAGLVPVVRLRDQDGRLVAIAAPSGTPGLLHPGVVLI